MTLFRFIALALLLPLASGVRFVEAQESEGGGAAMRLAASLLLDTLDSGQLARALQPMSSEQRESWHFIPMEDRTGLSFKDMASGQAHLANALVAAGLSHVGYLKIKTIMSLEQLLYDLAVAQGRQQEAAMRDGEKYFFAFYGDPRTDAVWSWRVEGHHLSLHFTLDGESVRATTPAFLGANPHLVREGPRRGLRPLGAEEDLARALLASLSKPQREKAILRPEAPPDVFTANSSRVSFSDVESAGLSREEMDGEQRRLLNRLIEVYISNIEGPEAAARRARVREAGNAITFAWMGSVEKGRGHYYRVHGSTFLIEYDNTQNGANHSHTVWRDYENDFGRDWLAEHYRTSH